MLLSTHYGETTRSKYGAERFNRFMDRRSRYDPHDLFLNPVFIKIASQEEPERYPGVDVGVDVDVDVGTMTS